eukprot:TRINITY_DN122502_c0_g1_i1.p1 TRINITY_DN122502_c0_g1~~TRINITY_DN122502_c0_g1_i1.p1  ORF type:complete len:406 (-),score=92.87 TRINITY_DN122502_c0_g1_i1:449-1666(-)
MLVFAFALVCVAIALRATLRLRRRHRRKRKDSDLSEPQEIEAQLVQAGDPREQLARALKQLTAADEAIAKAYDSRDAAYWRVEEARAQLHMWEESTDAASCSGWSQSSSDADDELAKVTELRAKLKESGAVAGIPGGERWLETSELLRYVRARSTLVESEELFKQGMELRREKIREWNVDVHETGSFGAHYAKYVEGRGAPDWWNFLWKHLSLDVYGADSFGMPLSYFAMGQMDLQGCAREVGVETVRRFCIYQNDYYFDRARAATKSRQLEDSPGARGGVVIVDLQGFGWRHLGEVKTFTAVGEAAKILHPERQRKMFLIRAPRMFSMVWRLVTPVLDQRTVDKISILDDSTYLQTLLNELGPQCVPDFLGGSFTGLPRRQGTAPLPEGAFAAFCKRSAERSAV